MVGGSGSGLDCPLSSAMLHSGGGSDMARTIDIRVADLRLTARLEVDAAPQTCAAFLTLLPLRGRLLHARWSGESAWVPLGDTQLGLGPGNHTSHPSPRQ